MKYIIISPYSRPLRNGQKNHPKNYPYWDKFIELFKKSYPEIKVFQIGTENEPKLDNIDGSFIGLNFKELLPIIKKAECWFSVDNFLQHFCALHKIPGIVVYSVSNPEYFGYKENINLLKDKYCLRSNQFGIWEDAIYDINAFIDPSEILEAFNKRSG